MSIGNSLLLLTLLLTKGQDAGKSEDRHLSKPRFMIPVSLQAQKINDLQAVVLYVSTTRGRSWELHGRIKPGEEGFAYLAKADGTYWFTVAVLDKAGKQDPRDVYQTEDRLKIVVDTVLPEVLLESDRQGSVIHVRWDVREEHLDLASMKMEARLPGTENWVPVQIRPSISGSGTIQVQNHGQVELRMSVKDKAGNEGIGTAMVPTSLPSGVDGLAGNQPKGAFGARMSGELVSENSQNDSSPGVVQPAGVPTLPLAPQVQPVRSVSSAGVPSLPNPSLPSGDLLPNNPSDQPPPAPVSMTSVLPVSPPLPNHVNQQPDTPLIHSRSGGLPMPISANSFGPAQAALLQGLPFPNGSTPVGGMESPVLASSIGGSGSWQTGMQPGGSRVLSQRPVHIVSRRQVKLEFEVTKSGSSGIGSVEVFVTLDDGLTWALGVSEPVVSGPGDLATVVPQRMGVMLPLSQEGVIYGFTLVVKSKAGLGRPAPQRGEPPQIRVELDSTHPEATLLSAIAEPSRRDALILSWKAGDRNLANLPIQLEWAERRDGPWHPISEVDLPNTGRHIWVVPSQVPPCVYMRLLVKDKAGNIAIAQTPDPLLVDLNVPEFQVLGIQQK